MQIVIKPFDTLFFRDGKPFDMGEETIANSLNIINPSTIYGAIRRAYFSQKNINFYQLTEDNDPTKDLVINKIYLRKGKINYVPIPANIFDTKTSKEKVLLKEIDVLEGKDKKSKFISNYKFSSIFLQLEDIKNERKIYQLKELTGFMRFIDLKKFLENPKSIEIELKKKKIKFLEKNHTFINENKIGIGLRNSTKSVEEGKLYRISLLRFLKNLNIVVEFSGLDDFRKEGFLKIGGENKVAYYYQDNSQINYDPKFENNEKYFYLYLLTPAIFKNDYIPEWIDNFSFEGELEELRLKLHSIIMKKPLTISGWEKNKPKKSVKIVPEGSVFLFEILEGHIQDVINNFHFKSFCDEEKFKKEGYGITIVGRSYKNV